MLEHQERVELAGCVCDRLVARHPDDILVAGAYGSTARGTDTAWSDLELLFVVTDGSRVRGRPFIYRGTAVSLAMIQQGELEKALTDRPHAWEYWMGLLTDLMVLRGDPARVQTWLRMGLSMPVEKFRNALQESLDWTVTESYGRLLSCRERGQVRDFHWVAVKLLAEIEYALCLLNRRWRTHKHDDFRPYEGLVNSFRFPTLPERYTELVPELWSARDLDEAIRLAEVLVQNFWRLLGEEGLQLPTDYQNAEELPL